MIPESYVWLVWSSAFLVPWHRKMMLWASLFTTPLGLTEPLFVPEYWSPPSPFPKILLQTVTTVDYVELCDNNALI